MKTTTSERLKEYMNLTGLRQVDILARCRPFCEQYNCKLLKSDLSQYVSGKTTPGQEKLTILGLGLGVSEAWLMGYDVDMDKRSPIPSNIIPIHKANFVPIVGTIACGTPILAEENIDSFIPVPREIRCDFCLKCKGNSMIDAGIKDGDIVYIRETPDVDDGKIAAVLLHDSSEATLKRVYHGDGQITLMPANPAYNPIVIVGNELSGVRILGVAVAVTSAIS